MHSLLVFRLILGVTQGLVLFILFQAYEHEVWPATNGYIIVPLVLLSALIPLLVLQASGNMRDRTLVIWTAVVSVIVISLGLYDVWRLALDETGNTPSPQLVAALLIGMFISHALVSGGDADRKIIASYKTHFDVAWKLAVQVALSAAFVGAFWIILWLGAGLFSLIGIDLFGDIIAESWFAIPAAALALATAIHVSDVRAEIVRGIRTLGLTLLSWLLPLLTAIALLFLAALPFTGLQPLWGTRFASVLLLVTAAALIVLINAAYQDGDSERSAAKLTRYFGRAAAIGLMPLVLLSGYALHLRVDQYGWTVDRIFAAAAIVIAGTYAGGYAAAALLPQLKMKFVEIWNFYSACLILGIIIVLFSPIAGPMRVAGASQINRLDARVVAPEDFDLAFLRWDAGRYGLNALRELNEAAPS